MAKKQDEHLARSCIDHPLALVLVYTAVISVTRSVPIEPGEILWSIVVNRRLHCVYTAVLGRVCVHTHDTYCIYILYRYSCSILLTTRVYILVHDLMYTKFSMYATMVLE